MNRSSGWWSRLWRVWIVIALIDGLFATVLNIVVYDSTFTRLWQGVASTVGGSGLIGGGASATILGLALHGGVALFWSALFLWGSGRWRRVREALRTPAGVIAVAGVYGPLVWCVMSLVIIPAFTGRAPRITTNWWVQLVAHIPFVALPIVGMTAWTTPRPPAVPEDRRV